jgi:hypothetical protein
MRNQVVVLADNNGNVIRQSNNPDFGYIQVMQEIIVFKPNGWTDVKKLTAFINGNIEILKSLSWKAGQTLPGKIVIIESTNPFDKNNPNKHIKIAGNSGVICATEDGEPIYRKRVYDSTGRLKDVLIPHANKDEIKNSYNQTEKVETKTVEKEDELVDLNQLGLFTSNESELPEEEPIIQDEIVEETIEEDEVIEEDQVYIVPGVGEIEEDSIEEIDDDVEELEEFDEGFEFNL